MRGLETLISNIFASIEWVMCFRDPCHCCGRLRSWPHWTQQHLAAAEPPERFLRQHIRRLPPDPPRADRNHLFWPSAFRGPATIWGGEPFESKPACLAQVMHKGNLPWAKFQSKVRTDLGRWVQSWPHLLSNPRDKEQNLWNQGSGIGEARIQLWKFCCRRPLQGQSTWMCYKLIALF